jgi:aspartate/methionine/tyrosine aminotransferase
MFSSRTPAALEPNAISRTAADLRNRGVRLLDLTETNPTSVGLVLPPGALAALAAPAAASYHPDPLGLFEARDAIAADIAQPGSPIDPARLVLTASTSESYAFLFKLLCDAGDEVLVPEPSYPLFASLTSLEAVRARPYRLRYDGTWSIDRETLHRAWTSRTRAVLVVSPNNPTGSYLRAADRDWLMKFCQRADVAVISDEVFAAYPLHPAPDAASILGQPDGLSFVLGGLSKYAGLPQMKLGWIVAQGHRDAVTSALARLEVIADSFLSVATPVQGAVGSLLASGRELRRAIHARVRTNLATLEGMLSGDSPISILAPEGGWTAVLRVPSTSTEEALVVRLMNEAHVRVHPGFFFDFHDEAHLVVSLLPEPPVFEEALRRMLPIAGGPA